MRIYYVCEWTGESGGIKVLYDHVRLSRRAGFDARLAATGRFERADWFRNDRRETPAVSRLCRRLRAADVVVVPEFCVRDVRLAGLGVRQVAFVQNPAMVTGPLAASRFEAVIVPSEPLRRWVLDSSGYGGPVHVVPGMIEDEWFAGPRLAKPARPRVLIIDRRDKNQGEPRWVQDALESTGTSVTYVRPRMPRTGFVGLFREHDVYVHLSHPEGFPVSILEAFASRCLVVGFAGCGGLEFMRNGENCVVVPDGDWAAAVAEVQRLGDWSEHRWVGMLDRAERAARDYPEPRTADALGRLWSGMRACPSCAARDSEVSCDP